MTNVHPIGCICVRCEEFRKKVPTPTRASADRTEFERWLLAEHGLDDEWDEARNCYKKFACHLAWKAWNAARSGHEP